ncbi:MAG: hypothetical protein M1817_001111 [Caeruleum heppii]|nr:MAG: hypothetical protein M1817_001111 [Caeruleum heppii]
MTSQFVENAGIKQTPLVLWQPDDPPGQDVNLTKKQPTSDEWDHWHLFDNNPNTFEDDIPSHVRLSDLTVAYVIANAGTKERGDKWPGDFAKTGEIRKTRPNNGAPAIAYDVGAERYVVAFGFYQLVGGSMWNHVRTFLGSKVLDTKWENIKHLSLGDFTKGPPVTRAKKRAMDGEEGVPTPPSSSTKRVKTKAPTKLALRAPTPFYSSKDHEEEEASETPVSTEEPSDILRSFKTFLSTDQLAAHGAGRQKRTFGESNLTPRSPSEDMYGGTGAKIQRSVGTQATTTSQDEASDNRKPSDILSVHHRRQTRIAEMWQEGLDDMRMDVAILRSRGQ